MDARDYEDAYLREEAELLSALGTVKQEPVAWVGCGDCDCEFPCYHGKTTCLRLPTEKQEPVKDEPVAWMVETTHKTSGEKQIWISDDRRGWGNMESVIYGEQKPLYTRPQPDLTAEVERLEKCLRYEKMNTEVWQMDAESKLVERTEAYQRIAELEEAAREAREALQYHTSQTRPIFNTVEAILTLDAVLSNARLTGAEPQAERPS